MDNDNLPFTLKISNSEHFYFDCKIRVLIKYQKLLNKKNLMNCSKNICAF